MGQSIARVALVVRDYDEVIAFYTGTLGFTLVEDTYQPEQDKRWVVVAPPSATGTALLLARVTTPEQEAAIGNHGTVAVFEDLSGNRWDLMGRRGERRDTKRESWFLTLSALLY